MFRSSPLDEFKKKLQVFIDDFHSEKLDDQHKQIFKNIYRALPDSDKRSIHLEVKAKTLLEACDTPNLITTGLVTTTLLYSLTTLGSYLNLFRNIPIPSQQIVDTPFEIMLVSMLLIIGVVVYHEDRYFNRHNKPAHQAALKLFDEVAREDKKEHQLFCEYATPYEPGDL